MARIYVETSIPSFYYEVRTQPEMVAMTHWTRQWWAKAFGIDELVTSVAVFAELDGGEYPGKQDALELMKGLPILETDAAILEIVEAYLTHKMMPADPFGDALHLAVASYHRCDFLVTWNCQHLANANKFGQIRRINGILGLYVPELVTPMELLGENAGP